MIKNDNCNDNNHNIDNNSNENTYLWYLKYELD